MKMRLWGVEFSAEGICHEQSSTGPGLCRTSSVSPLKITAVPVGLIMLMCSRAPHICDRDNRPVGLLELELHVSPATWQDSLIRFSFSWCYSYMYNSLWCHSYHVCKIKARLIRQFNLGNFVLFLCFNCYSVKLRKIISVETHAEEQPTLE
jgi:hypothetical protein